MADDRIARLRRMAEERGARIEQGRHTGLFVAIGRRFVEIDGGTYGGLMAIELFTTVLPLMILGFGYFSGFADNASVGTLFVRQLGLTGADANVVQDAFGTSKALQSSWTIVGVAGFLIWGIPMAITVAGMFAKAWRREPFSVLERLWRGAVWFVLYLTMLVIRERIGFGISTRSGFRVGLFVVALVPVWAFWTFTPVLLVRDGARGRAFLAKAGLAGLLIDGVITSLGSRLVLPHLVSGWTNFGPIGVAMALMTWCAVLGYAWVVIACFSGVLWERSAPIPTVVEVQSGE